MKRTIIPGARTGRVRIPASKSQAHRLLICAALGEEKTEVVCDGISADIAATAKCLSALGAKIEEMETGFLVSPIKKVPEGRCDLYCGESGSTLRFLLPVAGALGAQAVFHREGRLPQRPLAPLDSVLKEHGMTLREDGDLLYCSGQLIGGNYTIAGNVSSQYISGLLMALPLLIRDSLLMVSGPLESAAYVAMTEDALQLSKLTIPKMGAMWAIPGQQRCHLPKRTVVEGDWSNTAFFLCMGALSKEGVTVEGLNLQSSQGDRGVLDVLRRFGAEVTEHGDAVTVRRGALHGVMIDAAPIPDLIPVLSVVASVAEGETRVENAYRLRLKESDRLKSTANLLRALGGQVEEKEDGLVITGVPALHGGSGRNAERPSPRDVCRHGGLRRDGRDHSRQRRLRGKVLSPLLGGFWQLERRRLMSSTYGENLHLTIFGQSHSPAIGVTVEGIPAGEKVDLDELQRFLNRRAPGKNVMVDAAQGGRRAGDPLRPCERLYLRRAAHGHHPQHEHPLAGLRESCCHAAPRSRGLHRRGQIRRLSGPRGRRTLFRPLDRAAVHRGRHLPANSRARGHHACEPHRFHRGHY